MFLRVTVCSKVLKEAFLFFLVAWNHEQKNVQMEQKMFAKQKICKGTKYVPVSQNEVHKRPMRAKCYLLLYDTLWY